MGTRVGRAAGSLLLALAVISLGMIVTGKLTDRWRVVPILSGSMTPEIATGSVIVAVPVGLEEVAEGDVLVYHPPTNEDILLAHRVIDVDRRRGDTIVRTKGDANNAPDDWRAKLEGDRAWVARSAVPYVGFASVYMRDPRVRLTLLTTIVLVLLLWTLRAIWSGAPPVIGEGAGA